MKNRITCCRECVAPKRHPGCQSHCEEYLRQKKLHDEEKEMIDSNRHSYMQIVGYQIKKAAKHKHNEARKARRKARR